MATPKVNVGGDSTRAQGTRVWIQGGTRLQVCMRIT